MPFSPGPGSLRAGEALQHGRGGLGLPAPAGGPFRHRRCRSAPPPDRADEVGFLDRQQFTRLLEREVGFAGDEARRPRDRRGPARACSRSGPRCRGARRAAPGRSRSNRPRPDRPLPPARARSSASRKLATVPMSVPAPRRAPRPRSRPWPAAPAAPRTGVRRGSERRTRPGQHHEIGPHPVADRLRHRPGGLVADHDVMAGAALEIRHQRRRDGLVGAGGQQRDLGRPRGRAEGEDEAGRRRSPVAGSESGL